MVGGMNSGLASRRGCAEAGFLSPLEEMDAVCGDTGSGLRPLFSCIYLQVGLNPKRVSKGHFSNP